MIQELLDKKKKIKRWNASLCKYTVSTPEEVIQETAYSLFCHLSLQVCVSSACARSGLQSLAAIPTAS